MLKHILSLIILGFISQFSLSQSTLRLEDIMKGESYVGHQPDNVRWTMDGKKILFDWNPYDQPGNSTYAYDIATGKTDSVTADFYLHNAPYSDVRNETHAVYTLNGDLFSYHFKTGKIAKLIHNKEHIHNLQYSAGTGLFYFQIDQSLYSIDLNSGSVSELVAFKKGREEKKAAPTLLEKEQLELFEYVRNQKSGKEWRSSNNIFASQEVKTIYFDKTSVNQIQISGDGRYITFRVNDYPDDPETTIEHYISADGYTYTRPARSKVSDNDPNHKLGIYDQLKDTVYYADLSTLPDIRKKPEYLRNAESDQYEKDRNIIMHQLVYSSDGKRNVCDIRSYDNKDRWIVLLDLSTGKPTTIEHQYDDAWIGGPGISSWNMVNGTLGWMSDNTSIYFQSEETGFSHLYLYLTEFLMRIELTSGEWEVHDVHLSKDGKSFYLTTNKEHPGNRSLYHLSIPDKELTPILTQDGNYEVAFSPDDRTLAVRYSYKNKPWELYLAPNKENTTLKQLTSSTTDQFNSYQWYDPEVISFTGEKDYNSYTHVPLFFPTINARLYRPEKSNGAAVIFVHGAGYLQNAHNYWSLYYREYMFHNLLRDEGYTILDIDYRASEGYGRDHRTAIYRHMGGFDLEDQLSGKQFLIDSLGIDPDRVGIYGGSYGGFITLMALLTKPGEFKCGAALRSVTDWSHYNHEYTSNILNYPGTDPDAYKRSSPIYYADSLQDRLLMLHGMVDDNVQFQDIVRLSQRFIELGKKNWELAVFPVEAHGFKESYSWADEYRRIYELFNEELLK